MNSREMRLFGLLIAFMLFLSNSLSAGKESIDIMGDNSLPLYLKLRKFGLVPQKYFELPFGSVGSFERLALTERVLRDNEREEALRIAQELLGEILDGIDPEDDYYFVRKNDGLFSP